MEPAGSAQESSTPAAPAEIHEDLASERRSWKIERAGWWIMAVLVLLGFLGLWGGGPLSKRTISTPDGRLNVTYERFARVNCLVEIKVQSAGRPSAAAQSDSLVLTLPNSYLEKTLVRSVLPQPSYESAGPEAVRFHFARNPGTRATVVLRLEHLVAGPVTAWIESGRPGADRVELRQMVYP